MLGISLPDFLQYEIADYVAAIKGYRIRKNEEWNMVRTISYYSMVAMNGTKIEYDKIRTPNDKPEKVADKKKAKWRRLT